MSCQVRDGRVTKGEIEDDQLYDMYAWLYMTPACLQQSIINPKPSHIRLSYIATSKSLERSD